MGQKRTPGLVKRGGIWHIDKQIRGKRLCESTGESRLDKAQEYLARRIEEIRHAVIYGERPRRTWEEAAIKYLNENLSKASIADDALHLKQLHPFIGGLQLDQVHAGTLLSFTEARRGQGIKSKSINLALGVVRHILNLAADEWIDGNGLTWLERAPKIKLLPVNDARAPYPLNWNEQDYLLRELPDYLGEMALFKVNTGTREQEVCQLQWDWEIEVPELNTSVFLIPPEMVKNREERLVTLNRIASSVIEKQRGKHPKYVFTHDDKPLQKMNGSTWRRKRLDAALALARDQKSCEFIKITSSGRYESLEWSITAKRVGEEIPVSMAYSLDDLDEERRAKGLVPIKGDKRKDYDLKQILKYKALDRFFQRCWPEVHAFANVRVHDLKHTYGRRLRSAGVSFEDRQDLLGHKSGRITSHYSAAELKNLIEAANRVCGQKSRKSPALVLLKKKTVSA
ncbi:MAG: hypothetical protein AMJ68_06955 [Acidithiobacillales bacterium SG8_45]|nr:MAG: hypothetical protein AMJ68_06955 [Acidithiobacillales bacterium SG8_45]